ncbi:ferritin-like domain-containing protein [Enhygromyxa salina]|nr:ferritin-like domain-containing protein [Enhygromyxa salina]
MSSANKATTLSDTNKLLEDLIKLDYDAIEAYDAAIKRLKDAESKRQLSEFRNDHQRHTQNLGRFMKQAGKDPPTGPGLKQILTKGKVVLADISGDQAILKAMKSNEDDTNAAYERAVQHEGTSAELRDTLRENLNDERRHRSWIERRIKEI